MSRLDLQIAAVKQAVWRATELLLEAESTNPRGALKTEQARSRSSLAFLKLASIRLMLRKLCNP